MHYKTIVLGLIQRHPQTYHHLCSKGRLLPTVKGYADQLKASHEAWKGRLSKSQPESNPIQLASEALEYAIAELENYLAVHFLSSDNDPISLDAAMAYIRRQTHLM